MALIISDQYSSNKGSTYEDDSLVTIDRYAMKVRSVEGLRISLQMAVHYKVGITFDNKTKLA